MIDGRFTMISHALLDSDAYRLLSPGAAVNLIEFIRRWEYQSRGGTRLVRGITFSWTTTAQLTTRLTWRRQRVELAAKGFLEAVNARTGLYRLSDAWKRYEPTADEGEALQRQADAQAERGAAISELRAQEEREMPPQNGGESQASGGQKLTPGGGQKLTPGPRGQKLTPAVGVNFYPPMYTIPPPPTSPTPVPNDDNPLTVRFTTPRTVTLNLLTYRVWPPNMRKLITPERFIAWADAVYEHWDADEDAEAKRLLTALEASVQSAEQREPIDAALHALRATSDESTFIATLARLLGNSDPQSRERVRRVYNQAGPEALAHAARELIADGAATVPQRFQWLAFRAGVQEMR